MLCHSRRVLSRGHPRGFTARLYRLWSREAIRRIFRYCFHLVNSSPAKAMSPGATLVLYFLSPRPSPRCDDYSRSAERVQGLCSATPASAKGPLRDFKTGTGFAGAKLSEILPSARVARFVRMTTLRSRCSLGQDDGDHARVARFGQDEKWISLGDSEVLKIS
jgi:hypothetical protein